MKKETTTKWIFTRSDFPTKTKVSGVVVYLDSKVLLVYKLCVWLAWYLPLYPMYRMPFGTCDIPT